mmetsp:Transcript_73527/g.186340  ORF Transcript_73527/g.186340 Transcript_73527/m.186340 type:complete len:259 (+) Transcript_73527:159-935(+)
MHFWRKPSAHVRSPQMRPCPGKRLVGDFCATLRQGTTGRHSMEPRPASHSSPKVRATKLRQENNLPGGRRRPQRCRDPRTRQGRCGRILSRGLQQGLAARRRLQRGHGRSCGFWSGAIAEQVQGHEVHGAALGLVARVGLQVPGRVARREEDRGHKAQHRGTAADQHSILQACRRAWVQVWEAERAHRSTGLATGRRDTVARRLEPSWVDLTWNDICGGIRTEVREEKRQTIDKDEQPTHFLELLVEQTTEEEQQRHH